MREGIFNRTDVVTNHFIALTNKALTGDALPIDARVLIPVYSVGTANANQSNFTNKACNTSFFISGREPLFIAATANQTKANTPSAISNLIFQGIKIFNPIAPLFAGATAVTALTPVLNGLAATQEPLKQLFAQFDSKGTQTYSAPVYVGETNIRTPYSRTTVTVKEVPSILKTENGKFIISFEDTLKGYSDEVRVVTLNAEAVAANCRSYSGQLVSKNFPAYDVAYGLSYVTQTAGLDKKKAVPCLGKQYGLLSVKSFTCPEPGTGLECLWNRFNRDPLTVEDFTDPYPIQKYEAPFFKSLQNTMTDYAAAIAKGAEPSNADLAKYFQVRSSWRISNGWSRARTGRCRPQSSCSSSSRAVSPSLDAKERTPKPQACSSGSQTRPALATCTIVKMSSPCARGGERPPSRESPEN